MNIFFRIGDEVVTPELSGTILPGVTRESALSLLEDWGLKATTRRISMAELAQASEEGSLLEIFGAGTAAVIASRTWEKKFQQHLLPTGHLRSGFEKNSWGFNMEKEPIPTTGSRWSADDS